MHGEACVSSARAGIHAFSFNMKSAAQMQLVDGTTAVVRSELMRKLMAMVERVAQHDAAVLIVGETGVGKEMVRDISARELPVLFLM